MGQGKGQEENKVEESSSGELGRTEEGTLVEESSLAEVVLDSLAVRS